jgi:hypothetical protein
MGSVFLGEVTSDKVSACVSITIALTDLDGKFASALIARIHLIGHCVSTTRGYNLQREKESAITWLAVTTKKVKGK